MSRRIYLPTKSRHVRNKALEQLRQTRAHIQAQNPGLIGRVQESLNDPEKDSDAEEVVIDRQKNLKTVSLFLQTDECSPTFRSKLVSLLQT